MEKDNMNIITPKLRITCHACPTQIEGTAYGQYIYFRERNGYWTFGTGDTQDDAVSSETLGADCPEFMDTDDALNLTLALIEIYLNP